MTLTKQNWYGIIAVVVILALGLAGFNIRAARKAENERAMIYQLKQLREAVQIYVKTQKVMPQDLKAVLVVSINGKAVPIQWSFQKDASGNPEDPFGVAYQYDKKTGRVVSASNGYESW